MSGFEFPSHMTEESLNLLKRKGFIYSYEGLDGGWKIHIGKDTNPLILSASNAFAFCLAAEMVDFNYTQLFRKVPELREILKVKRLLGEL